MALVKKWLQKNQIYDRDLCKLLPEYGIDDPDKDLSKLKSKQWTEIQDKIKRLHKSDKAVAITNINKKLTKFGKLWKAARKERKTKKSKSPSGSATSPHSPLSPNDSGIVDEQMWEDHGDHLIFSDVDSDDLLQENGFNLPPMQHHQSVVQMLLSVDVETMGPGAHGLSELGTPDDIAMDKSIPDYSDDVDEDGPLTVTAYSPGKGGTIITSPKSWAVNADREHINESQLELDPKGESLHSIAMGKSQQWQEHDDHLRFSDDEEPEAQTGRERERDTISTQESVVDLLINGPAVGYSGGGAKC